VVVVRVWDLSGQYPLGVQRVQAQVVQRAEQLAQARGAVEVAGQVRLALQDLDLAQVQGTEWEWVQEQEQVRVVEKVAVAELELESALPQGYRLDSEQGLVRDWERVQVAEMELG
jgi:hypothetical protein